MAANASVCPQVTPANSSRQILERGGVLCSRAKQVCSFVLRASFFSARSATCSGATATLQFQQVACRAGRPAQAEGNCFACGGAGRVCLHTARLRHSELRTATQAVLDRHDGCGGKRTDLPAKDRMAARKAPSRSSPRRELQPEWASTNTLSITATCQAHARHRQCGHRGPGIPRLTCGHRGPGIRTGLADTEDQVLEAEAKLSRLIQPHGGALLADLRQFTRPDDANMDIAFTFRGP
jgi:hypothetical protein